MIFLLLNNGSPYNAFHSQQLVPQCGRHNTFMKMYGFGTILKPSSAFFFMVTQAWNHGRGHLQQCPLNIFVPLNLCCSQENLFQTYNKNKNLVPLKLYFAPPNFKTWLRACRWPRSTFSIEATSRFKQLKLVAQERSCVLFFSAKFSHYASDFSTTHFDTWPGR